MKEAAEKMQEEERNAVAGRYTYDDATLEKLQHHFSSYDDLLRYIKRYGMHRHFEHNYD
ncbi:hypothetical protein NTE_00431 [Candidatus Nitrososphaera evergladensis SR1]|uniref:Uncharacterized protein n=1 Tax=Candidatus Nitrososphaera evergladensis SR1 TaxID=1459636 RepID=A0A075MMM7_9ARCH|nr:hypothetical protein [Candidatus Nitrososphaera evergladensis]AIF82513.1 hypothetical protein NTE_00431 [Candidatus Nitrososphaera evergladensis SR1]